MEVYKRHTVASLPVELERVIFLHAARIHRGSALNLALISRRVQDWVDPILYEVVSLTRFEKARLFLRTLRSSQKPPEFFARRVQWLCICYNVETSHATEILARCTGICGLACWIHLRMPFPPLTASVTSLRVSNLSITMKHILELSPDPTSLAFFDGITHLEILDSCFNWPPSVSFACLPRLQYLAIDVDGPEYGEATGTKFRLRVDAILNQCPNLKVCIMMMPGIWSIHDKLDYMDTLSDLRCVLTMYPNGIKGWEARPLGHKDMWDQAEQAVEGRRRGRKRGPFFYVGV